MSENMILFHDLYKSNLLKVEWDRSDLSLSISRAIGPDIKDKIDDLVINDFMNFITEIMDYVTQKNYSATDTFQQLKEVMDEDFEDIITEAEKNVTLIEPTLETVDVEYLTKRSYRDVNKVLGYNVKLKFNLSNQKEFNIELDERQLNVLAESISSTLEELQKLK